MKLKTNTKAPNFKLPCTDKSIFQLSKIKKKNIILYFYPKDDTPGCTIESKDFSKLNNLISKNNSIVFGISKDSIKSHLKFKKKYKLKFNLLADEKLLVIKKYGVWGQKSFLGKKYMGIVRTTFLINLKGKIHKIWSNVRVKDHAKEVLEELKNIYNNFFISCIDLRSEISYGVFLMKKLLGILVLVFLFCGKANAGVNEAI